MEEFVNLLPEVTSSPLESNPHGALDELSPVLNLQQVLLYEAVCCALKELISSNADNALLLYDLGAVPKLIEVSRGGGYRSVAIVSLVLLCHRKTYQYFIQNNFSQSRFQVLAQENFREAIFPKTTTTRKSCWLLVGNLSIASQGYSNYVTFTLKACR